MPSGASGRHSRQTPEPSRPTAGFARERAGESSGQSRLGEDRNQGQTRRRGQAEQGEGGAAHPFRQAAAGEARMPERGKAACRKAETHHSDASAASRRPDRSDWIDLPRSIDSIIRPRGIEPLLTSIDDVAVLRRCAGSGRRAGERRERLGGRVPVGVVLADRDHRQPRPVRSSSAPSPASSLPWWATLSTSTGPGSIGTASASASAVSSIEKSRQRATSDERQPVGVLAGAACRRAAPAAARGRRSRSRPERSSCAGGDPLAARAGRRGLGEQSGGRSRP